MSQGHGREERRRVLLPPDPGEAADLEVGHHLAELVDRLVDEGWEEEEARREAERRFGDPRRWRARFERDERRRRTMMRTAGLGLFVEGLARAARSLVRDPGFSAGVVLTLALGIGANTAMFGILDRLLFQPPSHVADAESVRRVLVETPFMGRMERFDIMSHPDFLDLRGARSFQGVAGYIPANEQTLGSGADASRIRAALATWDFFPLLGVRAEHGRFFSEEDDRVDAPGTAVVSHEYWRAALGADPGVLGRTLEITGEPYTIVGVAPPGFTGVDLAPVDVWLPLLAAGVRLSGRGWVDSRQWYCMSAVVRIAPGADVAAARDEATALLVNGRRQGIQAGEHAAKEDMYPGDAHVALDPLIAARGPEASAESKVARWLGGVSVVVLLIACANVANLLLARGTRRRREIAVRLALGVGRARLVGTMVVESLVLALLGAVAAVALAHWGGDVVRRALLPGVLFPDPAFGGRALLFTLGAAVVAGLFAGVVPALQATRAVLTGDLSMGAGTTSGRRSRTRALLTVAQAGLSVVLLVGAGLFVRSVSAVRSLDLGLDVDRLLVATLEFRTRGSGFLGMEDPERNEVYASAMERLRGFPDVEAVAGTSSPFQWGTGARLRVPGRDSLPRLPGGGPYVQDVTPSYLTTVGLRVLRGRDLSPSDGPGAERVALISETMSRTLWPDEEPLGQCLLVGDTEECTTVVGVVEDASRGQIREDPYMTYYLPLAQREGRTLQGLYIRTADDPERVAATLAPVLRGMDPRVRFATVRSLREQIDPQTRSWTLGSTMFSVFGLLALLVAAVGLYGVLAFDVAQRTRELGIRTALGAERTRLLRSVVLEGVRLAVVGVALGLGVALAAAPRVGGLLFDVSPRDPVVMSVVAVTLLAVALLAALVPAVRATRVDPVIALRTE